MTIAPIPLIRSAEEITPEWATDVLRANGNIADDSTVTGVETTSFGEDAGLLGELFRVALTYANDTADDADGAAGPPTFIVKLPSEAPEQRAMAEGLGLYLRELTFYTQHAAQMPFGVAGCYGAVMAEDSVDFVIVMEDLGALDQIDQVAGATLDQARTAMVAFAEFHALFWEHADLPSLGEVYLPLSAPVYQFALPAVFEANWPHCKEREAANLTPEMVEFGDRFAGLIPFFLDEMAAPATLIHGDARGDNMLLDADDRLFLIDFQVLGVATGLFDVAYFLCQTLTPEVRRGHDEALVQLYVDTLAASDVEGFGIEEAMRLYRICTAFCLFYATASYQSWDAFDGRQHDLMTALVHRTTQSVLDNDCLALLPPAEG